MSDGRLRETAKLPVSAGNEEGNEKGRRILKGLPPGLPKAEPTPPAPTTEE